MATAKFHSLRGEKSALVLIKANPFVFSSTPVYIPREAVPADAKEGDDIDIPDGYSIVDMIDPESGEVRAAKDGTALKVLAY